MSGRRRLRILGELAADGLGNLGGTPLCEVSRKVVDVTNAGIMLMSDDGPRGSLCSTGPVASLIEDLHYTLGEGPCLDAYSQDQPVLEPDLADPRLPRWPAFSGPAVSAGVRAIFAFPLHVGSVRLGALNLMRDRPGDLTDDQHADALIMAGVAAQAVLVMQADMPPETLSVELVDGTDFHYVVHQAAGMVSVQLDVSVAEALAGLRAYAFGNELTLTEVARDVVARQLRFNPPALEMES